MLVSISSKAPWRRSEASSFDSLPSLFLSVDKMRWTIALASGPRRPPGPRVSGPRPSGPPGGGGGGGAPGPPGGGGGGTAAGPPSGPRRSPCRSRSGPGRPRRRSSRRPSPRGGPAGPRPMRAFSSSASMKPSLFASNSSNTRCRRSGASSFESLPSAFLSFDRMRSMIALGSGRGGPSGAAPSAGGPSGRSACLGPGPWCRCRA